MSENKTVRSKPHFLTPEFQSQDCSINFDVFSWFEYLDKLPKLKKGTTPSNRDVAAANKVAEALWNIECERYDTAKSKDKNHQFLMKSAETGTFSDQLSSLNVLIVTSPLHEIAPNRALDKLFKLLDDTNINKQQSILEAIKNTIFILLGDFKRAFKPFSAQNLLSPTLTPRHLLMFRFEQELEACYLRFLSYLEKYSHSQLAHNRLYAGKVLYDLILTMPNLCPEVILAIIIDKIGDPEAKISSNFKHYLNLLSGEKPEIYSKKIIQKLCEKIVAEKSLTPFLAAALNLLSLIKLRREWSHEASLILNSYLSAFHMIVACADTKPERSKDKAKKISKKMKHNPNAAASSKASLEGTEALSSKQISYILTGIHRVLPYVPDNIVNSAKFKDNISKIYDLIPRTSFSTAITALTVLAEIETRMEDSDKLYTVIFTFMQNSDFRNASAVKLKVFVELVYDICLKDPKPDRAKAFILQLSAKATFLNIPFAAQSLIAIADLFSQSPKIATLAQHNSLEDKYNPRAQGIFESHPETTSLWISSIFMRHYHPSLQIFMNAALNAQPTNYKGDTTADFRTMNFLDKLVDKKAKSKVKGSGSHSTSDILRNMREDRVPETEKYIHEFLKRSAIKSASKQFSGELNEDEVDEIIRQQLAKEDNADIGDVSDIPSDDESWEGWSEAEDQNDDDMADALYGDDE